MIALLDDRNGTLILAGDASVEYNGITRWDALSPANLPTIGSAPVSGGGDIVYGRAHGCQSGTFYLGGHTFDIYKFNGAEFEDVFSPDSAVYGMFYDHGTLWIGGAFANNDGSTASPYFGNLWTCIRTGGIRPRALGRVEKSGFYDRGKMDDIRIEDALVG